MLIQSTHSFTSAFTLIVLQHGISAVEGINLCGVAVTRFAHSVGACLLVRCVTRFRQVNTRAGIEAVCDPSDGSAPTLNVKQQRSCTTLRILVFRTQWIMPSIGWFTRKTNGTTCERPRFRKFSQSTGTTLRRCSRNPTTRCSSATLRRCAQIDSTMVSETASLLGSWSTCLGSTAAARNSGTSFLSPVLRKYD